MKLLKFLCTARIGFLLVALLAFAATVLDLGRVNRQQVPIKTHQGRTAQTR